MLDDVFAVKGGVFNEGVALLAVEDLVFDLAFGASPFDNHAERVCWSAWRVGDIGWNKEGFAFANDVIDDATIFKRLYNNVTLDLIEKLFTFGLVIVIPGIWTSDYHRKEVSSAIEVLVADGWLEICLIVFGPLEEINRGGD